MRGTYDDPLETDVIEDASLSLENSDDREVELELALDPDLEERMLEVSEEPISVDRSLVLELA